MNDGLEGKDLLWIKFSMGKCLSCWKKNRCFQPNSEHQVTPQCVYHECSRTLQPKVALGLITCRPSSTCKMGRKVSSSSVANDLLPCKGRHTLLQRFRKSKRQQSRVNFDSQEDVTSTTTNSSDHFTLIKSRKPFSSRKLSIVSCHRDSISCDNPQGSLNLPHANELQGFSRRSTNTDTQKRISFSDPVHGSRCFPSLETKPVSSGHWTVDRSSYPPSLTTSLFSLPTVISSSSQVNVSVAESQEHGQPNKDLEDALHHRSQSQSRNHSAVGLEQHLSLNRTSTSLLRDELSSLYQTVNSLTVDVNLGSYGEESFDTLPLDEDIPSPIEMAEIRYITANTDTEEQSFPVPKALNTHIEDLKLDVLLQKVDHLRLNEAHKMESFELLCDHKEKFSEEIEFLWRLVRAYGDMYDLSTNTQEKKHYANVGKTLGERAITRAPMNGHCHLWYALLCGYVSEFEGLQNKINCGHLFKKHLDIAIQLLPEEPVLYYLKGRYCYTVSKLSWIEKKMAATLFGEIPSSTVHEALHNFLKTEELQPGYSVSNYMYVAKCYVDLGESREAWKFCNLALLLPIVTKEDKDAHKEVKKIIGSLKRAFCTSSSS
ncbi:regulator of microtubule dynamics protein 2 isoform X3 [Rattus norvegicus]|uniref:Regulator of microtubule dynamics protein 2 n=1 Tax=Rattus norvegicus TaxID=10116 RepID=A0ABK0LS88_RAT|nr:regulator of microtubule dynamics protein 2 isoform X2 [Rattus norvegicus]|eukprot:XP_006239696.1 PREDICTED: regulator of microtubule dynamics protein 2 isoform X2 [Rattus norvegicus]